MTDATEAICLSRILRGYTIFVDFHNDIVESEQQDAGIGEREPRSGTLESIKVARYW